VGRDGSRSAAVSRLAACTADRRPERAVWTAVGLFLGISPGFHTPLRPFIKTARIIVAPTDPTTLTDAYILVDEYYLKVYHDLLPFIDEPPAPAYLSNRLRGGSRSLNSENIPAITSRFIGSRTTNAVDDLAAARAAVAKERTPSTLHYLLDAAAGAGAYCEAVRAWFDVRAEAPQDVPRSIPCLF